MTAHWSRSACDLLQHTPAIVRITVAQVRGSTPREAGATMLVTRDQQHGTIGGGQLEWQATELARRMLREGTAPTVAVTDLRLGPDLAQCCGGDTSLWLERIDAGQRVELAQLHLPEVGSMEIRTRFAGGSVQRHSAFIARTAQRCSLQCLDDGIELIENHAPPPRQLWIFGAGHVGTAVIGLLDDLPLFEVRWIDNRAALLTALHAQHIRMQHAAEPAELVATASAGTYFLVLTHDHELDFQICAAVLARGDAAWLGLIGSKSKSARFRSRLRRAGVPEAHIATLNCPVGVTGIRSKLPAAIAVGIASQLLAMASQEVAAPVAAQGCEADCRGCVAAPKLAGAAS
jgi:xanthine dehydrogenase accessory factor